MEQLQHFSHEHLLSLVQLHPNHNKEIFGKEDEDKDDFVVEELPCSVGECKMCEEEIYSFQLCYYSCKDCDYPLHTICAQQPITQQNHPLHPDHNLTLSQGGYQGLDHLWKCDICSASFRGNAYHYNCSICKFDMDIKCATITEQKIDHPSHPHQLQRHIHQMISRCSACGDKHSGTFYHCTTCSYFMIHLNCALLPTKLLIQQSTKGNFSHPHLLTLTYSFPYIERKDKFFPSCRVCEKFFSSTIWHYRCDKCRYYAHVDCATLTREAFMSSILQPAGLIQTFKNFKDDDHPNLIHYPFPDESVNRFMHLFSNKGKLVPKGKINGEMFSHAHPLILVDTFLSGSFSLHDPMKKVELLCDGCVRPIADLPFYKCTHHQCGFVLHEWCTRLPSKIQHHHDHPKHMLVLLPKIPSNPLGMFSCKICKLPCNGFAYGCIQCEYYVDINCGFIPDVMTHEAHPNHLLLRIKVSGDHSKRVCNACFYWMEEEWGFHCPTCDIYLDICCALLLPRTIRHKYDKHPLSLRYYPAENHIGGYFCDICEDEFDPEAWFYHCTTCASSMHTACAAIKTQCEKSPSSGFQYPLFWFLNVKFGGKYKIRDHPHHVTFVQGINYDGQCTICDEQLQYKMIYKCFECSFACHHSCTRVLSKLAALP